ncbi:hypothetical protein FDUTEX481_06698 [Tolypothrix sp. PCC 7601]|nr:hypothetical protein FDUTEX481_06698 [Tolypothrix sp. PCC 7601]
MWVKGTGEWFKGKKKPLTLNLYPKTNFEFKSLNRAVLGQIYV